MQSPTALPVLALGAVAVLGGRRRNASFRVAQPSPLLASKALACAGPPTLSDDATSRSLWLPATVFGTCLGLAAGTLSRRLSGKGDGDDGTSVTVSDLERLRRLFREGALVHPLGSGGTASLLDLAHGVALCRGLAPGQQGRLEEARAIAAEIGGEARRHIVFVLCDGMGSSILDQHLPADSFLRSQNKSTRLISVFPSTTPTALTTLVTAEWPAQHGVPGWDLREHLHCEFPGQTTTGPVQLRILHDQVSDMRSGKPVQELGYKTEDVFKSPALMALSGSDRLSLMVSAYVGTDFTDWAQGHHIRHDTGEAPPCQSECATIPEIAQATLGTPETAEEAVAYFRRGADKAVAAVRAAERAGRKSYVYLYTAHPDKHMHALGIESPEVGRVVRGLDAELARLWALLGPLGDVALFVTADHGHVTVAPSDMVTLPEELLDCLEYANIGVHGKGRHAYFHCKSGRQRDFEDRWARQARLREHFLLLTVEAAAAEGLFGPSSAPLPPAVRPRLGDFLAVALGPATLVTPAEAQRFRDAVAPKSQGAHGSLLREEMRIPFVLCTSPPVATQGAVA